MDAIEKRAREIYADQFPGDAGYETREWIMAGTWGDDEVIAAIIAALTPPEGYAETLRDAARYRYIRSIAAGEPHEFGWIEEAAFVASNGDPEQFDFNIDEQMAARPEVP
ncbi:hypothetical protein [uncultured Stenotrophomonas sp.]|uniref:hypothetical protein n=1 Tax=uncultured Stenotrophomonas sp. TaxID=165438 RepID=UPI00258338C8|nr:hypothetical protein [uncultured Stenotrophomonas sp.]